MMKDRIKANQEKERKLKEYKKEHNVDPWRATGQTTRALFDLASRQPNGTYMFITHNEPMAKLAMEQFVRMQAEHGAPIKVNWNRKCVTLQNAEYYFRRDSDYLRQNLMPTTTIIEDHMVGYERSKKREQSFWAEQEWVLREEARNSKYKTTKD